ncbi:MAG: F-box protein [archaeon]|nr:F-box protein [archaeon]
MAAAIAASTSVPHINALPSEILLYIFLQIKPRDLANIAGACKFWQGLVLERMYAPAECIEGRQQRVRFRGIWQDLEKTCLFRLRASLSLAPSPERNKAAVSGYLHWVLGAVTKDDSDDLRFYTEAGASLLGSTELEYVSGTFDYQARELHFKGFYRSGILGHGDVPSILTGADRCLQAGCGCSVFVTSDYPDERGSLCESCHHPYHAHSPLPEGAVVPREHAIACDEYSIVLPPTFARFEGRTKGHEGAWDGRLLIFPDPQFDLFKKAFTNLIYRAPRRT